MKFNYKKIATLVGSALMVGSTLGVAAAASYTDAFTSGAAVVYGASAVGTDKVAATNIQAQLGTKVAVTGATGMVTTVEGDSKELSKDNTKINLGDKLNSVYASLDKEELSTILADGVYEDLDGTEYDYEQKITLGNATLTHFANEDAKANDVPVIGFDIVSSAQILNYTLDFTDSPLNVSTVMDDTFLEMLGVKYYISSVAPGLELTLLDSANTATVDSSGPKTVTVGDKPYEVEIVTVSEGTTNKATLKINGVKIDSTNQGSSRKIDTDTYLSIVDVNEASRETDLHYVEFSIGSGKVVLKDGENIKLNDKSIDGLLVDLTSSAGALDQIKLIWTADEESFLVPGKDLVLPGLGSIKLSMTEFVQPEVETMSIANSGNDYIQLKDVKVKDGTIASLPILYSDTAKTNFTGLGKDASNPLVTASNNILVLDEQKNSKFVASRGTNDDFETYVFELLSINEVNNGVHNETTIKNIVTDTEYVLTDNADTLEIGDITLTTSAMDADLHAVTITLSGTDVYADRIFTAAGMGIRLPLLGTTANTISANKTSWIMNITEGDKDNNIDSTSTTVTLGHTSSDGPHVSDVLVDTLPIETSSDDYEGYVQSPRATKMLYKTGGDQDTLEIMYPKGESYAKVYVSESAATFGSGTSGVLLVTDAEIATVQDTNLVVVGGSCINSVAAKVLGLSGQVCGADFTAATSVGAGQYLIQTLANPYTTGKVAMLVAGYDAADTLKGATDLVANHDKYVASVGKKYTGTSTTIATAVTTA